MQAMSLVVTDGDGEQNEMRMLQDKLAATMKVVMTLTTQLTELKEQVFTRSFRLTAEFKHVCFISDTKLLVLEVHASAAVSAESSFFDRCVSRSFGTNTYTTPFDAFLMCCVHCNFRK